MQCVCSVRSLALLLVVSVPSVVCAQTGFHWNSSAISFSGAGNAFDNGTSTTGQTTHSISLDDDAGGAKNIAEGLVGYGLFKPHLYSSHGGNPDLSSAKIEAFYEDHLVVTGTPGTYVTLTFSFEVHGTITRVGEGSGSFSSHLSITNDTDGSFAHDLTYRHIDAYNQSRQGYEGDPTFTVTTLVGTKIRLSGENRSLARSDAGSAYPPTTVEVLYGNSLYHVIQSLTPGGGIVSESGYAYAAAPEPASFAALGAGILVLFRRRRR